jgi:hypothetical protein
MLRNPGDDADRALALGYASHLLVDIIAHNHFVPAHEAMWFDRPVVTHALCEWAMDAHVAPHVFVRPAEVLLLPGVADYVTRYFSCDLPAAARALRYLHRGERLLRVSRVPQAAYRAARAADPGVVSRFDYYIRETTVRLAQINRLIAGESPEWAPELAFEGEARERVGGYRPRQLAHRLPLPGDLFEALP